MRNVFAGPVVVLVAALALSSVAPAQAQRGRGATAGANAAQPAAARPPAGPAPTRDLNGIWTVEGGYGFGTANRGNVHAFPPMTPLGEARFKENRPEPKVGLAASNDPFGTCDPLGFPRNVLNQQGFNASMRFIELPDRVIIIYQLQKIWREVWKDGRQLPAKVDAKGFPDSRFYGFSVGHWDGDYTFVVETVGTDERTWLDNEGHPHSSAMRAVERYTRLDQETMALTLTIDDPQIYTKSFDWITNAKVYLKPQLDIPETLCLPSEALTYRESLVDRTAIGGDTPQTPAR